MNRILPVALLSTIFLACPGLVRADIALGADDYVNNASRVELVRVQEWAFAQFCAVFISPWKADEYLVCGAIPVFMASQ